MMNWTGGRLQRHSKSNSNKTIKSQKNYFARARSQAQHTAKLQKLQNPQQFPSVESCNQNSARPSTNFDEKFHQPAEILVKNDFAHLDRLQQDNHISASAKPQTILSETTPSNRIPPTSNIPCTVKGRASKKETYDALRLHSLEVTRRSLLDREDWLRISAAKPLQINFKPPEALRRIAKHRAVAQFSRDNTADLSPKTASQCLGSCLIPSVEQQETHVGNNQSTTGNISQASSQRTESLQAACPSSSPVRSRIDISTGSILLEKFENFMDANKLSGYVSTGPQIPSEGSVKPPKSQDRYPAHKNMEESVSYPDMGMKFSDNSLELASDVGGGLPRYVKYRAVEEQHRIGEEPKQVMKSPYMRELTEGYAALEEDTRYVGSRTQSLWRRSIVMPVKFGHEKIEQKPRGQDHALPAETEYLTPSLQHSASHNTNSDRILVDQSMNQAERTTKRTGIASLSRIQVRAMSSDPPHVPANRHTPPIVGSMTAQSLEQGDCLSDDYPDDDIHEQQTHITEQRPLNLKSWAEFNRTAAQRHPEIPVLHRKLSGPPISGSDASVFASQADEVWLNHVLAGELDQIQRDFEFSATPVRRQKLARDHYPPVQREFQIVSAKTPINKNQTLSYERRGRFRVANSFQAMQEIVYSPILNSSDPFRDVNCNFNDVDDRMQFTDSTIGGQVLSMTNYDLGVSDGTQRLKPSFGSMRKAVRPLLSESTATTGELPVRKRAFRPMLVDRTSSGEQVIPQHRRPITPGLEGAIVDLPRKRRALEMTGLQNWNAGKAERTSRVSQAQHQIMSPGQSELHRTMHHDIISPVENFKFERRAEMNSIYPVRCRGHGVDVAMYRNDAENAMLSSQRFTLQADLKRSRVISQTPSPPFSGPILDAYERRSSMLGSKSTGRLTLPPGRGKLIRSLDSPIFQIPSSISTFASM